MSRIYHSLKQLVQDIISINIEKDSASQLYRRLYLNNQIALSLAVLCSSYLFIFGFSGLKISQLFVLPTVSIYILSILLNKKRYHNTARALLVVGTATALLFYSNLLGEASGAHLLLFALVAIPLILFEYEQRVLIFFTTITPIIYMYILQATHFDFVSIHESLTPSTGEIIHQFASVTTFLMIILSVLFYYKSNRKFALELQESNVRLESALLDLQNAFDEIKEKKQIDKELDAAREIQLSVLPRYGHRVKGYTIDQWFSPATRVGGDYFDYLVFSRDQVGIIVADIVGKGIPASLMTLAFRNCVTNVIKKWDSPSEAMEKLNPVIHHHNTIQKYVPVFYGVLDVHENTFSYCNAGFEPGLLIQGATIKELDLGGAPLGMYDLANYEEGIVELGETDRIVLATDGASDIMNKEGERLEFSGLLELLRQVNRKGDDRFLGHLEEKLRAYHDGISQADDLTVISIFRDSQVTNGTYKIEPVELSVGSPADDA